MNETRYRQPSVQGPRSGYVGNARRQRIILAPRHPTLTSPIGSHTLRTRCLLYDFFIHKPLFLYTYVSVHLLGPQMPARSGRRRY